MSYRHMINSSSLINRQTLAAVFIILLGFSYPLFSQEGHPLVGSWSGDRLVNDKNTRVLVLLIYSLTRKLQEQSLRMVCVFLYQM